jgi:hypothetical protein
MELVFAGPAAPCGERLKGSFSVFGSGGIPVDGTVAPHPEGGHPLAFDLRFVEAAYELTVDGKPLAKGRKEKFLLHAGRANRLLLPVELSNGGVLSGLWKAATGGRVEGVLTGIARLRVPAGELVFPFEFPVKLSRK